MTLQLDSELSEALDAEAKRAGKPAEELAIHSLRARFLTAIPTPRNEWERRLLESARDCGVSLSDEALSREEIYD